MAHCYPDYEGDKSGLYPREHWAAKEGADKNFTGFEDNKTWGQYVEILYTVPATKTLYITQYSFGSMTTLAANGDLPQHCAFQIMNVTDATYPVRQAADGGAGLALNKPIVIEGAHQVSIKVLNFANHACNLWGAFGGYEV